MCSNSQLANASITTVNYSYLTKKAGVIQLSMDVAFALTNSATADFQTIFTIPEEFRPSNSVIYQRSKGTSTFDVRVNAITGEVGVFTQYYTDIKTIRDTVFYMRN